MYRLPHIRGSICIVLSLTDGALTFCSFSSFLCSPSVALSVWLPGHLVTVPQTTFCIQNTAMLIIFQSRSMERNNHISDFVSERNCNLVSI